MKLVCRCDGGRYQVTNGIYIISDLSRDEYLLLLAEAQDGHTCRQAFQAAKARHAAQQEPPEAVAA